LNHGLYGLIIVTAALVAEQEYVDEAGDALALLLGTTHILFLAHAYSEMVALRVIRAPPLGATGLRTIARNNVPLLFAIVVCWGLSVRSGNWPESNSNLDAGRESCL
jgi:hypothetical protein